MENMNQGQATGQPINMTPEQKDIEENKIWAAISYISILSIVVLLLKKESKFAQFHSKQGLIMMILSFVAGFIPFIGWFLLTPILFIVAIYALIMAATGKWWKIPVVGDLAEKINI